MGDSGGTNGTNLVQVEATLLALIFVAYTSFLAPITVVGDLCVLEPQLVSWVHWVSHLFLNLHVFCFSFFVFRFFTVLAFLFHIFNL